MQVVCVQGYPGCLTVGKIYDVIPNPDRAHTYITDDAGRNAGWLNYRFNILAPREGWNYCNCGALTKNGIMCCDCIKSVQTVFTQCLK